MAFFRIYWLAAIVFILTGCQTLTDVAHIDNAGQPSIIASQFKHLAIYKPAANNSHELHVYIEGDGIPFQHRIFIADDPSPLYPFVLEMMKQDAAESLYLGRPCYFNNTLTGMDDAQCAKKYWTSARYSDAVITSMVGALRAHLQRHPAQKITVIGHSGGGAIAMLMAARMPEITQVVTIAGNLNTTAWTRYHGYTPLNESLNPATEITTATPKHQLHFGGSKDNNIPPSLVQDFLASIGQKMIVIENSDHACCWIQQWRKLLTQIQTAP